MDLPFRPAVAPARGGSGPRSRQAKGGAGVDTPRGATGKHVGKFHQKQREEREAAAEHYAAVSQPLDGREALEESEDGAEVLWDEAAGRVRGKLPRLTAHEAALVVDAVRSVLEAADRAVVASVVGGGASEAVVEREQLRERMGALAMRIVDAPRPKFSAGCLALACGFEGQGMRSQRQWAASQGFSPEYASDEVLEWQRFLGLPPTSAQKSEAACAAYKATNGARGGAKTNL